MQPEKKVAANPNQTNSNLQLTQHQKSKNLLALGHNVIHSTPTTTSNFLLPAQTAFLSLSFTFLLLLLHRSTTTKGNTNQTRFFIRISRISHLPVSFPLTSPLRDSKLTSQVDTLPNNSMPSSRTSIPTMLSFPSVHPPPFYTQQKGRRRRYNR